MLMFLTYVNGKRYAIESTNVMKIIPNMKLKKMLHVSDYIAGFLILGKLPIPVIDFTFLLEGRFSVLKLHTRIVLFKYVEDGTTYIFGVRTEKMTHTIHKQKSDFIPSSLSVEQAVFLDGILTDSEGIIQLISDKKLFDLVRKEAQIKLKESE